MSLNVTPVPRNLATKVTFLYLEFDDLFAILVLAVVMNMFGRFLQREMFGIPMNVFLQYVVPVLAIPEPQIPPLKHAPVSVPCGGCESRAGVLRSSHHASDGETGREAPGNSKAGCGSPRRN